MEVDTANPNNALSKGILGTDQELRVYYKSTVVRHLNQAPHQLN